jgi:hypothetical protein
LKGDIVVVSIDLLWGERVDGVLGIDIKKEKVGMLKINSTVKNNIDLA